MIVFRSGLVHANSSECLFTTTGKEYPDPSLASNEPSGHMRTFPSSDNWIDVQDIMQEKMGKWTEERKHKMRVLPFGWHDRGDHLGLPERVIQGSPICYRQVWRNVVRKYNEIIVDYTDGCLRRSGWYIPRRFRGGARRSTTVRAHGRG